MRRSTVLNLPFQKGFPARVMLNFNNPSFTETWLNLWRYVVWAQLVSLLHHTRLEGFSKDKHSSLLGPHTPKLKNELLDVSSGFENMKLGIVLLRK